MTDFFYKTTIKRSVLVLVFWVLLGAIIAFFRGLDLEFLGTWVLSAFIITWAFEKIKSEPENSKEGK